MSVASKKYDVVIYGATGFVGVLATRYLNSFASDQSIHWAVAGRSRSKIEKQLSDEGITVPVIIADSSDEASVEHMVKQTKCVIAVVGPYGFYGTPIVKACAENGVHYVDLNGEPHWHSKMIQQYGRAAVSSGALLVPGSGYDSVPGDLTTFLAVQRLKKSVGEDVKVGDVRAAYSMKGTLSGGTWATLFSALDLKGDDKKALTNPYALSPIAGKQRPKVTFVESITYRSKRIWGALWMMSSINEPVVRRTWGLLERADASSRVLSYGPDFTYREIMKVPNPLIAALISSTIIGFMAALALIAPFRWLVRKLVPQSGQGPSPDLQKNGWFTTVTVAKSVDKQHEAQVVMKGKGDPGYAATAKMIVESALCMVKDHDRLPPLAKKGGFLTPATAFGNVLVERLEKTGFFTFTAEDAKTK